MLDSVRLRDFKTFEDENIPFAPFTLLLGSNGAGKSSIIQALLVLKQSWDRGALARAKLELNGSRCRLGVGRDALRHGAEAEEFEITLQEGDDIYSFLVSYQAELDCLSTTIPPNVPNFLSSNLTYLTADRIGPRLTTPRNIADADAGEVGTRGEGALAVLERSRAKVLDRDDPRRSGQTGSLEELFQFYLDQISPSVRVDLHSYDAVDAIGSSFSYSPPGGLPGAPMRPTNVGFGLSYSLAIIVASLAATKGSMLIVENPEAHLHTYSQRAMFDLLARTSQAGVQVIVESHSREFFHRLRGQTASGVLQKSLGRINFIDAAYDAASNRRATCSSLAPPDDSLATWPQAFFEAYGTPMDLIAPVG